MQFDRYSLGATMKGDLGRVEPFGAEGRHETGFERRQPIRQQDLGRAARLRRRHEQVEVGLGAPKQELWMANHRSRLDAPVLVGVGAAFDFHAGLLRQAPPVLQRMGLEWAFRLAMEPRRLAGRYLRNNPAFIALLIARALRLR